MARLHVRGPEWFARTGGELQDYLNWAAWMREHAADPSSRTEVIRQEATLNEMRWSRWSGWRAGDPRQISLDRYHDLRSGSALTAPGHTVDHYRPVLRDNGYWQHVPVSA